MIGLYEFTPELKGLKKMNLSKDKIQFVDKITRTTTDKEFDRVITYKNRKGEEYTRI